MRQTTRKNSKRKMYIIYGFSKFFLKKWIKGLPAPTAKNTGRKSTMEVHVEEMLVPFAPLEQLRAQMVYRTSSRASIEDAADKRAYTPRAHTRFSFFRPVLFRRALLQKTNPLGRPVCRRNCEISKEPPLSAFDAFLTCRQKMGRAHPGATQFFPTPWSF